MVLWWGQFGVLYLNSRLHYHARDRTNVLDRESVMLTVFRAGDTGYLGTAASCSAVLGAYWIVICE